MESILILDSTAKQVIHEASVRVEADRVNRLSRGEDPRSRDELGEREALDLAVKEGTLFYYNSQDEVYQWDQPRDWQGVAIEPIQAYQASKQLNIIQAGAANQELPRDILGETNALTEYEAARLKRQEEKELRSMRSRDGQLAMEAAENVEHSRHLRVVGKIREWLNAHGHLATVEVEADHEERPEVFDLRKTFLNIDEDRSGLISYEEFKVAIAQMGLEIKLKDQHTLLRHFDPNKNKVINYSDFILFCLDAGADTASQWFQATGDHPSLAPVQWEEMREGDRVVRTVGNWEEYKATESGERYFFNALSGTSQWEKPYEVAVMDKQTRDAKELEQAQTAASLAARSAAEAAAQAERASEKSIDKLVRSLATSDDFVNLLAEKLQIDKKEIHEDAISSSDSDSSDGEESGFFGMVPKLFEPEKQSTDFKVSAEGKLGKPGLQWRLLRPAEIKRGFVTSASEPHTMGFAHGLVTANRPSLVGVVDPVEVSHIAMEQYPDIEVKFISDIMEDTERYMSVSENASANVDSLLDRSGEEDHLERVHEAFMACKNARIDKLEMLMDEGVKVDERDDKGNTMLLIAAQQGLKRISKFLLRRGADINAQNLSGNSILHYCFEYSFNELAEYFISKGADDSLLNAQGLTAYEGLSMEKVSSI